MRRGPEPLSDGKNNKKTFGLSPHAHHRTDPGDYMGLLIDTVRCTGCMACFMACKEVNELPNRNDEDLNKDTYTVVKKIGDAFVRRLCMHCVKPACESVCPVAALQKTALGPVIYDEDRCIGCRYCMMACPFGIPTYEWDSMTPRVEKCYMCYEKRVSQGKLTGCAQACAYGATIMGKRKDLIALARKRIQDNPDKYHPYIYGEHELGGTGTMYLSAVPFENIPFLPAFRDEPLPILTWNVLHRLPDIVVLAGVLMAGVTWIVNRRLERVREERGKTAHAHEQESSQPQEPDAQEKTD